MCGVYTEVSNLPNGAMTPEDIIEVEMHIKRGAAVCMVSKRSEVEVATS